MNMQGRERDTVHHRDGVVTTSALPPLENQKKSEREKKKRMEEKRSLQIGILKEMCFSSAHFPHFQCKR